MRRERRPSALIIVVVMRAPQWHMLGGRRPPVALTRTRTCGVVMAAVEPASPAARTAARERRRSARRGIYPLYAAHVSVVMFFLMIGRPPRGDRLSVSHGRGRTMPGPNS